MLRVLLVGELRASGYIRGRGCADIRNLNIHSESWTAIKAALTSGLYPNLARYSPVDGTIITQNETRSQFHFTSTLLVQEGRNNGLGFVAAPSTESFQSVNSVCLLCLVFRNCLSMILHENFSWLRNIHQN